MSEMGRNATSPTHPRLVSSISESRHGRPKWTGRL